MRVDVNVSNLQIQLWVIIGRLLIVDNSSFLWLVSVSWGIECVLYPVLVVD